MNTSLLKHNRRLKQKDSLPLNAARGAEGSELWKSLSVVQGQCYEGLEEKASSRVTMDGQSLTYRMDTGGQAASIAAAVGDLRYGH